MRPIYAERLIAISKKNFRELSVKSFKARVRGHIFQGFVVKRDGKFFAYQNLCQHLPITLDLGDGQFFTHDKKYLQCHTHGAMYEMASGECIAGPCVGARLTKLELLEEEAHVLVKIPEGFGSSNK